MAARSTNTTIVGAVALLVSIVSSAALVWIRLSGHSLPGCGVGSPCARLGESAFSAVPLPGGGFPVSMLGLAFFVGLLSAWLLHARGSAWRWIVRVGALLSLMFVGVAFAEQLLCQYCLLAHLGNLVFWGVVEFTSRPAPGHRPPLLAGGGAFVGACLLLATLDNTVRAQAVAEQETQLEQSVAEITRTTEPKPDSQSEAQARSPLTGRWRLGPGKAAIRIVMWIGYQCPDCRRLDAQAMQLARERDDVSLTIRHFPMHPDCNEALERAMHGNACWSARAAEVAGEIAGSDGFFRMHEALFSRAGRFEQESDLRAAVAEAGLDPDLFMSLFSDRDLREQIDARIRDDAAEAIALGLYFTPMIFINGVELKGWAAPDALTRAVAAVAGTNPAPAGPENDRPPLALDKAIADWAESPRFEVPAREDAPLLGPASAALTVTLWGDYGDPASAEADRIIRGLISEGLPLRYAWRHFPLDKTCNPGTPMERFASCRLHRAALGAAASGDIAGFWAAHAWLIDHPQADDDEIAAKFREAGVAGEIESAEADRIINQDATAWLALQRQAKAANTLHRRSLPTIVIDDRIVPRWKIGGAEILSPLIRKHVTR